MKNRYLEKQRLLKEQEANEYPDEVVDEFEQEQAVAVHAEIEIADDDEDDYDGSPEIEMNWNLATYLPEEGACQKNFNTVIAGIMSRKTLTAFFIVLITVI